MRSIGTVLYGSQCIGLDTPTSDHDYRVFLTPTFDDLYNMKRAEVCNLPDGLDSDHYQVFDIRSFDKNVRNGNPNTLELLFSPEQHDLYIQLREYFGQARILYMSGYLALVARPFFKAVTGIVYNAFRRYGMTTKTISRAMFWFMFCRNLINRNFIVDNDSWFYAYARRLRFDEKEASSYTEQQFTTMFAQLEDDLMDAQEKVLHNISSTKKKILEEEKQELYKMAKYIVLNNI